MADQPGKPNPGASPWKSVSGRFFPWQNFFFTPGITSFVALFCQIVASFIVSLKVALLATQMANNTWTLTVRTWPALILICGYTMMAAFTIYIGVYLKGKSTGLKWDPISIADFASLFS